MTDSPKWSDEYRAKIAAELKDLRRKGNTREARERLQLHKQQFGSTYALSRALSRDRAQSLSLSTREHDERIEKSYSSVYITSNEPSLFEAFPFIRGCGGVGVGIGMDQMLDIAVNSDLEQVVLLDNNPAVSLTTRAVLEIGRRHHELFESYPTSGQFIDYFRATRLPATFEMISPLFSDDEMEIIRQELTQEVSSGHTRLYAYFSLKAEQREFRSWVQEPATIIRRYEEGNIIFVSGDLTGDKSVKSLAERFTREGKRVSLVYLSNAEEYIGDSKTSKLTENMSSLPIDGDTIVISTAQKSKIGTMDIPSYAASQIAEGLSIISWRMDIRSARDQINEEAFEEREEKIGAGRNIPEELNLTIPKKGLIVSLDVARKARAK